MKKVSSKSAIIRTIGTDRIVYRWFSFLIKQPNVKIKILNSKDSAFQYEKLKMIERNQLILYSLTLLLSIMMILTEKYYFLLASGGLTIPFYRLLHNKRQTIASISACLLESDFDDGALSQKTLFTICEFYSKSYGVPALVSVIAFLNQFTIIAFCAVALLLYFSPVALRPLPCIIYLISSCLVIINLVQIDPLYKRIK